MTPLQRRRELLRHLYGFDFPEDFDRFWELANRLKPLDPLNAVAEQLGLVLTGPFEVLAGRFDHVTPPLSPHLHWRYYNDPPEFFTVLTGATDGLHWGYYLDDPMTATGCIASYYANDAFELGVGGNNLFEAVRLDIEETLASSQLDHSYGLEYAEVPEEVNARLQRLRLPLQAYATSKRPETGEEYTEKYRGRRINRKKQVAAATREGMGIVVPPEHYRPLSIPDKRLWRAIGRGTDLTDVVEEARHLLRDGFPGTALKLGKDLWANPDEQLTAASFELLDAAYAALGRDVLRRVLQAHREHRDRPWLDVLHQDESC